MSERLWQTCLCKHGVGRMAGCDLVIYGEGLAGDGTEPDFVIASPWRKKVQPACLRIRFTDRVYLAINESI